MNCIVSSSHHNAEHDCNLLFQDSFEIKAKFTDNSHIGYVKTIAANRTFLATGSTDETIHLYNVKTNRELGALLQHSGKTTRMKCQL